MTTKFYIIAGTHDQARDYIKKHCAERFMNGDNSASLSDYVDVGVGDVSKLRGVRNPRGVFVGSWLQRRDIHDICILLNSAHDYSNVVIHRVMQEHLGYN